MPLGRLGFAPEKLLVAPIPEPPVFGVPGHHLLWNKGGLAGVITEDAVILLSLLSLECRELVCTFAEAAWTPEALTGQLLLPVLSSPWLPSGCDVKCSRGWPPGSRGGRRVSVSTGVCCTRRGPPLARPWPLLSTPDSCFLRPLLAWLQPLPLHR